MRSSSANRHALFAIALVMAALDGPMAYAGGSVERTAVIIDPDDADSLQIGNYYVWARDVPGCNVFYIPLEAEDYQSFVNQQIETLLGEMSARDLLGRIDYIVFASSQAYRIPAAGYISETVSTCPSGVELNFISLTGALSTAQFANSILAGSDDQRYGLSTTTPNGYFSSSGPALAFDADQRWKSGAGATSGDARKLFIASMLGYTGLRGNTVDDIIQMIDRSISADATHPVGTFYYMKTTDEDRSTPRDSFFPSAIDSITALGGEAEELLAVLPTGQHDCLGVMTGWPTPPVGLVNFTMLPGAYGDHLTSWAATFNQPQQTKVAAWIKKGASAAHGTVEEPCAGAGKFPHPHIFVDYLSGLTIGEAIYRSLEYLPLQSLVYGDPLTQPFSDPPSVEVTDWPDTEVSGALVVTAIATPTEPGAGIAQMRLYFDGRWFRDLVSGEPATIPTSALADGPHDVRIVARDDSLVANVGRWQETLLTNNHNRSLELSASSTGGDLLSAFKLSITANVATVSRINIMQNNRVVASTRSSIGTVSVSGRSLGAGPVRLHAEAEFSDGTRAISEPVLLQIEQGGTCCTVEGLCKVRSQEVCEEVEHGIYLDHIVTCDVITCPRCSTGDFDGNGSVDLLDFAELQVCLNAVPPGGGGTTVTPCSCAFDFNFDYLVDSSDMSLFAQHQTPPLAAPDGSSGDFDGSHAVDLRDYAAMQQCYAGSGVSPTDDPPGMRATCLDIFDVDDDSDIDHIDFDVIAGRFSAPITPDTTPLTYNYVKRIQASEPVMVELPASDVDGDTLSYDIVDPPMQAMLTGSGAQRYLQPINDLDGVDELTFRAIDAQGRQRSAVIELQYPASPPYLRELWVEGLGETGIQITFSEPDLQNVTIRSLPIDTRFLGSVDQVTLTAPDPAGLSPFVHWVVDGEQYPDALNSIQIPLHRSTRTVATYLPYRSLHVRCNLANVPITLFTTDVNGQADGFAPFDRVFIADESGLFLIAPTSQQGKPFHRWRVDGVDQPTGASANLVVVDNMNDSHALVALYQGITGDFDGDDDLDLADLASMQRCFSGDVDEPGFESPVAECLAAFDVADPPDGDVDLLDMATIFDLIIGPL